jgi:hypothetical protein
VGGPFQYSKAAKYSLCPEWAFIVAGASSPVARLQKIYPPGEIKNVPCYSQMLDTRAVRLGTKKNSPKQVEDGQSNHNGSKISKQPKLHIVFPHLFKLGPK